MSIPPSTHKHDIMNKNILVCVKTVPTSSDVQVDSDFCLRRESVASELNIADESALEAAVRLRGGDAFVVALSMGPPSAADTLSALFAKGADRVVLLSDPALAGADTRATAAALAALVDYAGGAELILCGRRSIDGETGQIPGELASALGMPCVSNVESIERGGAGYILRRRLEDGVAELECGEGTVVSMCEYSYPPRLPGIAALRRSRYKTVERVSAADVGLTSENCGLAASPTRTVRVQSRYPGLRKCVFMPDAGSGARELVRRIEEGRA